MQAAEPSSLARVSGLGPSPARAQVLVGVHVLVSRFARARALVPSLAQALASSCPRLRSRLDVSAPTCSLTPARVLLVYLVLCAKAVRDMAMVCRFWSGHN